MGGKEDAQIGPVGLGDLRAIAIQQVDEPVMANTRYKFEGTSIALPNGEVLVAGGARVPELLDQKSMRFHPVSGELPDAYFFSTATKLVTGDVIIIGGYNHQNQNTAGVWRFTAR